MKTKAFLIFLIASLLYAPDEIPPPNIAGRDWIEILNITDSEMRSLIEYSRTSSYTDKLLKYKREFQAGKYGNNKKIGNAIAEAQSFENKFQSQRLETYNTILQARTGPAPAPIYPTSTPAQVVVLRPQKPPQTNQEPASNPPERDNSSSRPFQKKFQDSFLANFQKTRNLSQALIELEKALAMTRSDKLVVTRAGLMEELEIFLREGEGRSKLASLKGVEAIVFLRDLSNTYILDRPFTDSPEKTRLWNQIFSQTQPLLNHYKNQEINSTMLINLAQAEMQRAIHAKQDLNAVFEYWQKKLVERSKKSNSGLISEEEAASRLIKGLMPPENADGNPLDAVYNAKLMALLNAKIRTLLTSPSANNLELAVAYRKQLKIRSNYIKAKLLPPESALETQQGYRILAELGAQGRLPRVDLTELLAEELFLAKAPYNSRQYFSQVAATLPKDAKTRLELIRMLQNKYPETIYQNPDVARRFISEATVDLTTSHPLTDQNRKLLLEIYSKAVAYTEQKSKESTNPIHAPENWAATASYFQNTHQRLAESETQNTRHPLVKMLTRLVGGAGACITALPYLAPLAGQ